MPVCGASQRHLPSLDAARFVCAFIVTMAHLGQPPLRAGIDTHHPVGFVLDGVIANSTSSAAAVICFFVISGIVIHFAHFETMRIPSLPAYFARRYIRIVVPVLAAVAFAEAVGVSLSLFNGTILWSLAAELIYYTLYPLLLALRRRTGSWLPLIAASFAGAFGVVLMAPGTAEYPMFGTAGNALLGLPCWLIGCQVAEKLAAATPSVRPVPLIWGWRLAAFAAAGGCSVLRYHTPIGYPWSLNLFAIVAAAWLYYEVLNGFTRPLPRALTLGGAWSYSLYLFHKPTGALFDSLWTIELGPVLGWTWRMAFVLALAYVTYRLVERPSHQLARVTARALDPHSRRRTAPSRQPMGV